MDRKKYIDVINKIDLSNKDRATLINLFDEIGNEGSGGTSNYEDLQNKPSINDIELIGNKTLNDLGIPSNILVTITEEEYQIVQTGLATIIEKGPLDTLNGNDIKPMFDVLSKGLYFQMEGTIIFSGKTSGQISSRGRFSMTYTDYYFNVSIYISGNVDENGVSLTLDKTSHIKIPSPTPSDYFINIGGFTGFNQEEAKSLQEVISNLATKEELGSINTILDNINGEVI